MIRCDLILVKRIVLWRGHEGAMRRCETYGHHKWGIYFAIREIPTALVQPFGSGRADSLIVGVIAGMSRTTFSERSPAHTWCIDEWSQHFFEFPSGHRVDICSSTAVGDDAFIEAVTLIRADEMHPSGQEGVVASGAYNLKVFQFGTTSFSGRTITFKIGGFTANETGTWQAFGADVVGLAVEG